ncbi:hypothetical protein [Mucilaginibacter polytrichastri]|nr:hypothetical protein [Mucilaginibacter polytrichastri]
MEVICFEDSAFFAMIEAYIDSKRPKKVKSRLKSPGIKSKKTPTFLCEQ